ncbi:YchJ family protein [Psychrobacter sp. F1192]|uniref:YchJ family protein n=1 Tax=Psychrobacter coccoides TaxID=2818440 RepID=A0ABS3NSG3_9GAMM|nr:YchJ family protein [Psychrobacter coccoides]MBO1531975.1 YchJ family protein [Psychrobacter coccoides]
MSISLQSCPCQINPPLTSTSSVLAYQDCCQPYHEGVVDSHVSHADTVRVDSAERLMRSRYSAFVLVIPEYIVKTTLPAQQSLLDVQAIEAWAKETKWAGLEVVKHTPKLGKRHAQVEFKASFNSADGLQAHHELSTFVTVKDKAGNEKRWYFLDPTVSISVTQKQPCICGSGEKFKRCCGVYLP